MIRYLETAVPLSKNEMIDEIVSKMIETGQFKDKYRVKRLGIDEDDLFWAIGKIHGLENIAFVD
jgi:hypothetical protein